MIHPDKIERALARIETQRKNSELRKSTDVIADVRENVSRNPFNLADDIGKLGLLYAEASEEKKQFYNEIVSSLENAVKEHMQILLDDSKELVSLAGEVIDFKPFLRKQKGRPKDGLREPTSMEVEDMMDEISKAVSSDPGKAAELAVDLIYQTVEGGSNERYIRNFLAVLKGFPYDEFLEALKAA